MRNAVWKWGIGVASMLWLGAAAGQAVTPAIPSPAELDVPYSAANPPGPRFTADEKLRQRVAGRRIRGEIVAAFNAGRESYTIPPGNYRFDSVYHERQGDSFALESLHGDPARPFRILGHGATLWFALTDLPAPHHHQMIKLFDCSHITIEGVVVDSDPRGCMDATVTGLDFEGNRLQVRPVAGTRLIESPPTRENRFIPYKANGRHIAALYSIDESWGPGNVVYERCEPTGDGLYWLTMKSTKLLDTLRNDAWRSVYGDEGVLEIGDMVGILYSSATAITLVNCREVTIRDCRFHAAKAGLEERGGHGAHRWINCHFLARPGTNNLLGGDGTMSSCRHGSTFDGMVVQRTTDDCFNSHGHYRHAVGVTDQTITFSEDLPPELGPGHVAEAYETRSDTSIGRLTVERVTGRTVLFREPVGGRFATAAVMFPAFQNAGWVIRNSVFSDCYQRIRLMCGPGTFENNRVERIGGGLTVENGRAVDIEGGLPDGIVIRSNVFIDSGISPPLQTISVTGRGVDLRTVEVSGNLICNSGSEAIEAVRTEGLSVRDNIVIQPGLGKSLLPPHAAGGGTSAAIALRRARQALVAGNVVLEGRADRELLVEAECAGVTQEGNRKTDGRSWQPDRLVRALTDRHESTAPEIIAKIRSEIGIQPGGD